MTTTEHAHPVHGETHEGLGHVVPVRILITVFLTLVALTIVTVAATTFPTGGLEIWISLGIAAVKASLVAAYFMHLRYDNPLNAVIFTFGLLFIALFLGLTLMDTFEYQSELIINQ